MPDFFISYNKADREWAEWIAGQLEEAGYITKIQAWDIRPGSDFIAEMDKAIIETPMRPGRGSHVTDGKPHIVIRSR
jgi:hypothetical protein